MNKIRTGCSILGATLVLGFSSGCMPSGDDGGPAAILGDVSEAIFGGEAEPVNNPPTAVLAVTPEGMVGPGVGITLDGSGSSDPDEDGLSYRWDQLSGPDVGVSGMVDPTVSFNSPLVFVTMELGFRLTVTDEQGVESSAEAAVTIEDGGEEFSGDPQSVEKYRESLSGDEAFHLIRRAAFGGSPQVVTQVQQQGLTVAVNDLLSFEPESNELRALAGQYGDSIPRRWLVYLIDGPNPLKDRLAMFWHDRFATSRRVLNGRDDELAILHWEMLRRYAKGNYREFLAALTLDPLMLIWLDGSNSPKQDPNENYTREFWELFTLGRDILYTEEDIREGARAFTGMLLLREDDLPARPIFDVLNHDNTDKDIFPNRSAASNFDYLSVIDLTLAQPEAAQYVARNLFTLFVHDHPSDQVVAELADFFVASNFEIEPLVRRILTCQAMFSSEARWNQISSPVEHYVGVARTLDMHMYGEDSQGFVLDRLVGDLADAGQDLLNPAGVEGWDEDLGWMQDQWVLSRIRALGRTMEYGPDRTTELPYHLLPPVSAWTDREVRGQIVDAAAAAFHLDLSQEELDIFIEVLDQNGWLAFHLEQPDRQPRHVYEMIRLMSMHPSVIGR
jgi:hypothetical protein